jgi:hypothetical protein
LVQWGLLWCLWRRRLCWQLLSHGTFGGRYKDEAWGEGLMNTTIQWGKLQGLGNGNIVDWSEVEASLAENGALLDPSADNFAEQGFTGYVTSVNNEIVKLYVDGVGEY